MKLKNEKAARKLLATGLKISAMNVLIRANKIGIGTAKDIVEGWENETGWTPVSNGHIFCSPRCGYDCTHAMHDRAQKDGAALCALLSKKLWPGWTVRVWENLGWHHEAISPCGRIKVSPLGYGTRGFHAFLNGKDEPGGRWVGRGDLASDAVLDAIASARADLDKLGAIITGFPEPAILKGNATGGKSLALAGPTLKVFENEEGFWLHIRQQRGGSLAIGAAIHLDVKGPIARKVLKAAAS